MWRVTLSKAARVQSLKGLAPSLQVAGETNAPINVKPQGGGGGGAGRPRGI